MEEDNEWNDDIHKGKPLLTIVILVGDSGVGKTHFVTSFVKEKPPTNIGPTIGMEFSSKTLLLDNGQKAKMQIWDTAGQEQYKSMTITYS